LPVALFTFVFIETDFEEEAGDDELAIPNIVLTFEGMFIPACLYACITVLRPCVMSLGILYSFGSPPGPGLTYIPFGTFAFQFIAFFEVFLAFTEALACIPSKYLTIGGTFTPAFEYARRTFCRTSAGFAGTL
jgi:hypothetical protein